MRVLIDGDGCPVVALTLELAKRYGAEALILCDTAHELRREGARTITVSKGADSVDFALVNLLQPGDLVITQDYGLAAMCLARRAIPLHQDGMVYTEDNIDGLLLARHTAKKNPPGGRTSAGQRQTHPQPGRGLRQRPGTGAAKSGPAGNVRRLTISAAGDVKGVQHVPVKIACDKFLFLAHPEGPRDADGSVVIYFDDGAHPVDA